MTAFRPHILQGFLAIVMALVGQIARVAGRGRLGGLKEARTSPWSGTCLSWFPVRVSNLIGAYSPLIGHVQVVWPHVDR